jgi:hypothetical protein
MAASASVLARGECRTVEADLGPVKYLATRLGVVNEVVLRVHSCRGGAAGPGRRAVALDRDADGRREVGVRERCRARGAYWATISRSPVRKCISEAPGGPLRRLSVDVKGGQSSEPYLPDRQGPPDRDRGRAYPLPRATDRCRHGQRTGHPVANRAHGAVRSRSP